MDEKLRWNTHVNYLNFKVRKTIFEFQQVITFLPLNFPKFVHLAIVQSVIDYGIMMHDWCYNSNLKISNVILTGRKNYQHTID